MAAPDRHASTGSDRRASTRLSIQLSSDEDYDLDPMAISDGFRPADVAANHDRSPPSTSQHHDQPQGSQGSQGRRTPPPRPSSTTKPKYDSFALRHDGAMGPVAPRNLTAASTSNTAPTRSSSVSTDMTFVRAESPYQGPTGPSHPYQMYPQESRLARTASMATTSTVPAPERSYSGPSGPTHPYGMYPQNTVPEADSPHEQDQITPVPVGFPGLNNTYHRRLGPDGEEIADIIGPDGHTEQLPPYTQYPDEAIARKTRPSLQVPLPGAGGIGLATRNPEFASREDLNSPPSRHSTRSLMSESSHQINTAALAVSEKPQLKKWQQIARRRVCGIFPVWAIVLVGSAFILLAIILSTVLAILLSRHQQNKHHDSDGEHPPSQIYTATMTTMTTTWDASPFTKVPPNIQPLPTGTYILPISTPSIAPSGCIDNPSQSDAWSCAIPPMLPYQMIVSGISSSSYVSDNELTLDMGNYSIKSLAYGAQPPILTQPEVLYLATDNYDPDRGPAWFFQTPYDKLVILPEGALTSSNNKRSTNLHDDDTASDFMRKGVAQPGDKPWFCYWNATLLEAFIYVNETSSAGARASSSSYPTPTGATATPYSSGVPTSSASPYGFSGQVSDPVFLPCYPKVVKVEERRIPPREHSIAPYCVQHYIDEDGSPHPYTNSTGEPVTIYLNETEPTVVSPMGRRAVFDNLEGAGLSERQSSSTCGCVWLAQ